MATGINWSKVNEDTRIKIEQDDALIVQVVQDNFEQILSAIDKSTLKGLEQVGLLGERFAKEQITENKSVITGRLRNSITHVIDGGEPSVSIGTNVEYAAYVEYGTSKSKAKPYLRPAAQGHKQEYANAFKRAFEI